jgi:hypothetical protein
MKCLVSGQNLFKNPIRSHSYFFININKYLGKRQIWISHQTGLSGESVW